MPTTSKAKKESSTKKAQVKVSDLKPVKDAKGGGRKVAQRASGNNRRYNVN